MGAGTGYEYLLYAPFGQPLVDLLPVIQAGRRYTYFGSGLMSSVFLPKPACAEEFLPVCAKEFLVTRPEVCFGPSIIP